MRHLFKVVAGLLLGAVLLTPEARAQFFFPGGFGEFGMSQWGANPSAGYMAGLGAFARGKGEYLLDKAKADAINVETMVKWNKALRARQHAIREEEQKEAAQREAARKQRVENYELRDGTTLNNLLLEIFEMDPAVARTGRANTPISMRTIRAIPFEWDSEAITICLDRMTGRRPLPAPLMAPMYAGEREAVQSAVHAALEEDAKGSVSMETIKRINDAVANFRAKYRKNFTIFGVDHDESMTYFTTVASLSRMLNDPSMKRFLEKLETNDQRTVGDLIAFMDAFNLRFGRTTSQDQVEIYTRLVPILTSIRDSARSVESIPSPPDRSGEALEAAAKETFKSMRWEDLEAHQRGQ